MIQRPHTPTVLVRIDTNSALSVLQDAGVQVVLLDERVDPDHVILLPPRNQYEEILLILGDKFPVSLWNDDGGTAAAVINRLLRQRLIAGKLDPDAILTEITKAQEAQR